MSDFATITCKYEKNKKLLTEEAKKPNGNRPETGMNIGWEALHCGQKGGKAIQDRNGKLEILALTHDDDRRQAAKLLEQISKHCK